ncbi:MAG: hypothetical protein ACT4NJ_08495 [Nitrosopumilaceae archaeon]
MSSEIKSWLLVSIFIIFLIPTNYVAKADDETSWTEESQINVSIVGNSIINLDSNNRLIRAYVDILNFNPSDGFYYMRIVQTPIDKIITEKEIIIREKSNGQAGADIAYLIDDDDVINTNGTIIQGDYTIEVFSENGNSIGATTFSIIKPSVSQNILIIENPESEESATDTTTEIDQTAKTESTEESIENESELENVQNIPDWVKNIFILYADGSITENELISALKFLIEQGIIEIN